jgi:hypothetical protein
MALSVLMSVFRLDDLGYRRAGGDQYINAGAMIKTLTRAVFLQGDIHTVSWSP